MRFVYPPYMAKLLIFFNLIPYTLNLKPECKTVNREL